MTVKELRDQLAQWDDDCLVVQSCDREGNGYSPVDLVDGGRYEAETTYFGQLLDRGENVRGVPCVCLWPVN